MKNRLILICILAIALASCSKKSNDNSLRNLLILGYLTQSKPETVSLTAGVALRQKIVATQGQELKYTISQTASSSSSLLTRDTAFNNRVTASLIDSDNREVYTTVTIPGTTETISYTPSKSGTFTVSLTPSGTGSISTTLSGATASNTLTSENSATSALTGKRKYSIGGGFIQASLAYITIDEVTAIGSNGKPTLSPIKDAVVTLTVGTSVNSLTYASSNFFGVLPGGYSFNTGGISGKKVVLKISHPTISDLTFEKEIPLVPTTVSNVKINGISSAINSGTTLNLDKTLPVTFTWTNATGADKPDTTQISFKGANSEDIFIMIPASNETYTISKELLTGLTVTSTTATDDCFGIQGGAGSIFATDPDFFIGLDATGKPVKSGIGVIIFNLNNQFQPNLGFFCESGVRNPLITNSSTTYSSGGVPLLVVK